MSNGTMNKVIIVGFLGENPSLSYTGNGTAVSNLRLATNRRAGDETVADWHRITIWGKQAENAMKYLSKGRKVMVEGELRTRSYEKDGVTHWTTYVHAFGFQFMDAPKGEKVVDTEGKEPEKENTPVDLGQDDLPNF